LLRDKDALLRCKDALPQNKDWHLSAVGWRFSGGNRVFFTGRGRGGLSGALSTSTFDVRC
jgi:hypothetical protein